MPRRPIRGRAAVDALVSEDQFERWVCALAKLYGWRGYHVRKSYGVVSGVAKLDAYGQPDWTFWHPRKGKYLVRELKSQHGTLSRHQRTVLEELRLCGIDAKVWRPSDEQEILETFAV